MAKTKGGRRTMTFLAIAILLGAFALAGAILGASLFNIVIPLLLPKPKLQRVYSGGVSSRLGERLYFFKIPRHLEPYVITGMRRAHKGTPPLMPLWRGVTDGWVYLCFDGMELGGAHGR